MSTHARACIYQSKGKNPNYRSTKFYDAIDFVGRTGNTLESDFDIKIVDHIATNHVIKGTHV